MKVNLLVLTPGKWKGKTVAVTRSPFLIGRDPACQLRPSSPVISNRHCALRMCNGEMIVQDLGSTNGTKVNDQAVAKIRRAPWWRAVANWAAGLRSPD